jgi:hypothetical protein
MIGVQPVAAGADASPSSEPCRRNLLAVHRAIQDYRRTNHVLPERLLDLVPMQLQKEADLACPIAEGTLQRPRPTTTNAVPYLYEFERRPLTNELVRGLDVTLRTWRQWQMGRIGGAVPMVRCTNHSPALNLSFDGTINDDVEWQDRFSALVPPEDLSLENLLAAYQRLAVVRVPAREPGTPAAMIDLTSHYNGSLKGWLEGDPSENLAGLRAGRTTIGGVDFDARGVIQLGSRQYALLHRPAAVSNLVVGFHCRSLVFLHGTVRQDAAGTNICQFTIHFEDGSSNVVPVAYARDAQDWLVGSSKPPLENAHAVPRKVRAKAPGSGTNLYLHVTRWTNPVPDVAVRRIDFVSLMTWSSPFLVAVTAETEERRGSGAAR